VEYTNTKRVVLPRLHQSFKASITGDQKAMWEARVMGYRLLLVSRPFFYASSILIVIITAIVIITNLS
jgi:hypothetical protein